MVSCRQKDYASLTRAEIEHNARAYLQPSLHIGDSVTNVVARFGAPFRQEETPNHEVMMYFSISLTDRAAMAARVAGFEATFTNNQLAFWEPAYRQ